MDRSVLQSLRELQGESEPEILAELVGLFLDDTPPHGCGAYARPPRKAMRTLWRGTRMGALCLELQEAGCY